MSESNVLILQCDVVLKNYEMNELYDTILAQKEHGVILLPKYVKVVNVPEEMTNGELVVHSRTAEQKPKMYTIKSPGGMYLMSQKKDSCIFGFTYNKLYAQKFDKESAERIIKKSLGSIYTLEEL